MIKYKECLNCPYRDKGCSDIWIGETRWENGKVITKSVCAYIYPDYGTPIDHELDATNLNNNIDLQINYDLKLDGEEQPDNVEIAALITAFNTNSK